jgi:NAD(P)-dependent dehydrogenase (short-subunit alcohol dehydrogenase family)
MAIMKTVLITGAAGNLGIASVRVFATAGWRVIALVSPGKVPERQGEPIFYFEADLTDEQNTRRLVERLVEQYDSIDAALLLVGGFEAGGVQKADGAALKRMIALNFETAYHVARPLLSHFLRKGKGKVVFIGARAALDTVAGMNFVAYGLSKSLLFKFADYLNALSTRVTAHVMLFTALDTPQNRVAMPKADVSKWVSPERVANVMLRLSEAEIAAPVVEVTPG